MQQDSEAEKEISNEKFRRDEDTAKHKLNAQNMRTLLFKSVRRRVTIAAVNFEMHKRLLQSNVVLQ